MVGFALLRDLDPRCPSGAEPETGTRNPEPDPLPQRLFSLFGKPSNAAGIEHQVIIQATMVMNRRELSCRIKASVDDSMAVGIVNRNRSKRFVFRNSNVK